MSLWIELKRTPSDVCCFGVPHHVLGRLVAVALRWWNDEWLARSLTPEDRSDSRIWISVGDQESQENVMHSRDGLFQKASQRDSVRRLAEKLDGLCREVHHEEFTGGHDMACWAEELPRALPWLMR